ncbi:YjcZ family sporulation protein [Bacillus niameyensis]|uniref:YjcZ family sporulation protein n=1 Tax=Bacillus niameyensis TaxID=1522308 RepID=UPI000A076288|nr:YjcZ family sporulation protein [Bacillus niameyensis]
MYYGGYGYDDCCPSYGYSYGGCGYAAPARNGFALIVVLFILLIIIGACWAFPR